MTPQELVRFTDDVRAAIRLTAVTVVQELADSVHTAVSNSAPRGKSGKLISSFSRMPFAVEGGGGAFEVGATNRISYMINNRNSVADYGTYVEYRFDRGEKHAFFTPAMARVMGGGAGEMAVRHGISRGAGVASGIGKLRFLGRLDSPFIASMAIYAATVQPREFRMDLPFDHAVSRLSDLPKYLVIRGTFRRRRPRALAPKSDARSILRDKHTKTGWRR